MRSANARTGIGLIAGCYCADALARGGFEFLFIVLLPIVLWPVILWRTVLWPRATKRPEWICLAIYVYWAVLVCSLLVTSFPALATRVVMIARYPRPRAAGEAREEPR